MNPQLQHTPGPWRWEFNAEHRRLHLVGGRPQFDLTVIDFERWGMSGATMRLRDPAHDGMQLLYRVHERPDWIAPQPGREHHKHWHQLLTHPDARLIEAAPRLVEALERLQRRGHLNESTCADEATNADLRFAAEALASAKGGAT